MTKTTPTATDTEANDSVIITKTECHRVDYFYEFELDAEKLAEIYPEHDEQHLAQLMDDIRTGAIPVEAIIADAAVAHVEIPWKSDGEEVLTLGNEDFKKTYGISDD